MGWDGGTEYGRGCQGGRKGKQWGRKYKMMGVGSFIVYTFSEKDGERERERMREEA